MLSNRFFFFSCGGGALSAASLVPRGRCSGEDEGGAIQKKRNKKETLVSTVMGDVCLGGAAASYLFFTEALSFFPPFLCPDSSGVSITLSHSDLVEIFVANKNASSRATCSTCLDFVFHELTFFPPSFFLSFAK